MGGAELEMEPGGSSLGPTETMIIKPLSTGHRPVRTSETPETELLGLPDGWGFQITVYLSAKVKGTSR